MDDRSAGKETQTDYLSYLVRLWRDTDNRTCWRASLTSPHTGDLVGFANLDDLFDFLRGQAGLESAADSEQNEV